MRPPARVFLPILPALVLALATTLPPGTSAAAEEPLAIIMSMTGDVSVERASGEIVGATFGFHLEAGDRVNTAADSSAEIFFSSGSWIQVGASSNMAIQGERKAPSSPAAKPDRFVAMQNFVSLKDARGTSSITGLRSGTAARELRPVSACQAKMRSGHPVFRWTSTEPQSDLKFTVYDEQGVHWETSLIDATELSYPDDAPPLVAGITYSWIVETADPLVIPPLRSQAAFFELLDAEAILSLDADLKSLEAASDASVHGQELLRASTFYEYGVMDEAIDETCAALSSDPANPQLRAILARLYQETGRDQEALEEIDQLVAPH